LKPIPGYLRYVSERLKKDDRNRFLDTWLLYLQSIGESIPPEDLDLFLSGKPEDMTGKIKPKPWPLYYWWASNLCISMGIVEARAGIPGFGIPTVKAGYRQICDHGNANEAALYRLRESQRRVVDLAFIREWLAIGDHAAPMFLKRLHEAGISIEGIDYRKLRFTFKILVQATTEGMAYVEVNFDDISRSQEGISRKIFSPLK
jgi:hypothetical protein